MLSLLSFTRALFLCLVCLVTCAFSALGESRYIRPMARPGQSRNPTVIVFVHGLTGNERDTWIGKSGTATSYWPDLVAHDHVFDGADIFVLGYPTPVFRKSFDIEGLVSFMRTELTRNDVLGYQNIVFVAHSLGGVVTRKFVLETPAAQTRT